MNLRYVGPPTRILRFVSGFSPVARGLLLAGNLGDDVDDEASS